MKTLVFLSHEFNKKIHFVVKYMYLFLLTSLILRKYVPIMKGKLLFSHNKSLMIYFILDLKKNVYAYVLRRVCLNYNFSLSP